VGHRGDVTSVALGADPATGRLVVASGSWDNTVRLWDGGTGLPLGEPLMGHEEVVTSVALGVDPDTGRLAVASGSWDNTVRLWDGGTGRPLGEPLMGHSSAVTSVALGVDPGVGQLVVASGSVDCTVRLWDVGTGRPLGEPLEGHNGIVHSVALGADPSTGRLVVASGSYGNTVRLWLAADRKALEASRRIPDGSEPAGSHLQVEGVVGAAALSTCSRRRLLWSSRSATQGLDTSGVRLVAVRGLSETLQALMTYHAHGRGPWFS
jgi:WD40 repeat protein